MSLKIIHRAALATAPAPVAFKSRRRTEVERALLEVICEACDKNKNGKCLAAECCGGLTVKTILNLDTTHCPLKKF